MSSFPTSYIPTAGATVTRGADNPSDTNFAKKFNPNEGTFIVKFNRPNQNASCRLFKADAGNDSADPRIIMGFNTGVEGINGSIVFNYQNSTSHTVTGSKGIESGTAVGTYDGSLLKFFVNGVKVGETAMPSSLFSATRLLIGRNHTITQYVNGSLNTDIYYPIALTEAQALLLSRI